MDEIAALKNQLQEARDLISKKDYEIATFQSRIPTSSLDGLVIVDPKQKDMPIVFVNPVFETITGYTLTEVMGKNCRFLQGTDHDQEEIAKIKTAISQNQECRVTLRNYKKDGSLFWNELTLMPSFNDKHELISYVGLLHDVTREKEIDRMKTEFISLASHQLRTPLTSIKWFGELLFNPKNGSLTDKQKEYLNYITTSTDRMISLVNSLLNVSRIESGRLTVQPVPTNIQDMVDGINKDLGASIANKNIRYNCDIQSNLPLISVDPNLIRQVYLNLLTNAIKYTPQNGYIELKIYQKDDQLISSMKDTGIGIPKEVQPNIFKKFFRADNATKLTPDGNGLGLYLIKSIVEISGGSISFTSAENGGTTFFFNLPLTGSKAVVGEVGLN